MAGRGLAATLGGSVVSMRLRWPVATGPFALLALLGALIARQGLAARVMGGRVPTSSTGMMELGSPPPDKAESRQASPGALLEIPTLRSMRRESRSGRIDSSCEHSMLGGRNLCRKRKRPRPVSSMEGGNVTSSEDVQSARPAPSNMSWHCAKQLGKVLRSFWSEASIVTLPREECQEHMDFLWELDDLRCPLGECLDEGILELLLTKAWPYGQASFAAIFLDQWTRRVILGTPLITTEGITIDMSVVAEEVLPAQNRSFLMQHSSLPRKMDPEGEEDEENPEKLVDQPPTWQFARHFVMETLIERLFGVLVGGFDKEAKWSLSELEDMLIDEVTYHIWEDPVVGSDGRTYERASIEECLDRHGETPITKKEMAKTDLVDDMATYQLLKVLAMDRDEDVGPTRKQPT